MRQGYERKAVSSDDLQTRFEMPQEAQADTSCIHAYLEFLRDDADDACMNMDWEDWPTLNSVFSCPQPDCASAQEAEADLLLQSLSCPAPDHHTYNSPARTVPSISTSNDGGSKAPQLFRANGRRLLPGRHVFAARVRGEPAVSPSASPPTQIRVTTPRVSYTGCNESTGLVDVGPAATALAHGGKSKVAGSAPATPRHSEVTSAAPGSSVTACCEAPALEAVSSSMDTAACSRPCKRQHTACWDEPGFDKVCIPALKLPHPKLVLLNALAQAQWKCSPQASPVRVGDFDSACSPGCSSAGPSPVSTPRAWQPTSPPACLSSPSDLMMTAHQECVQQAVNAAAEQQRLMALRVNVKALELAAQDCPDARTASCWSPTSPLIFNAPLAAASPRTSWSNGLVGSPASLETAVSAGLLSVGGLPAKKSQNTVQYHSRVTVSPFLADL